MGDAKLTPEVHNKLCICIAHNLSVADAAAVARVSRSAVYEWLRKGDTGEEPYASLVADFREARAGKRGHLMEMAYRQAQTDGHMLRYLLGISDPKRYGKDAEELDPLQEAWGSLTDEEKVTEIAKLPEVRAAVLASLGITEDDVKVLGKGGE